MNLTRRLKVTSAVALATLGIGVAAAPAMATTRFQGAWGAATNYCLSFPGCGSISSLYGTGYDSRGCYQLHYQFHTSYGWKSAWTGIYCKPPYS